jgi:putative PIN family toxin of toxin-antitoxin system
VPERVVFDTNVLISGYLWKGPPHGCILAAKAGLIEALTCDPILDEFEEKLRERFSFSPERAEEARNDFIKIAERSNIVGDLRVVESDPDDDKILECATTAGASSILTGDRHLRNLVEYEGIQIYTPSQLLFRLSQMGPI